MTLWRDIVRSTNNIPDAATRAEMRHFARVEFEQHRHVTDIVREQCLDRCAVN